MATLHHLGLPRIGPKRELKWAVERFWRGESSRADLEQTGAGLRLAQWQQQLDSGTDFLTVGDFAWYDHVLEQAIMFNLVPRRFRERALPGIAQGDSLGLAYAVARGIKDATHGDRAASPMRKWFDTNYHYLVPEWNADTWPALNATPLIQQIEDAKALDARIKTVLVGPATLIWLSQLDGIDADDALSRLLPLYEQLLAQLTEAGVQWVQLDEPLLCLDLDSAWRGRIERAYNQLSTSPLPLLVATYFGGLQDNLSLALQLPVQGVHIDLVTAPDQLTHTLDRLGPNKVLSIGAINGRNIWRADLQAIANRLQPVADQLGDRLWLSSSCSLLHVPYRAEGETTDHPVVGEALSFMAEKQAELYALKANLNQNNQDQWQPLFTHNAEKRQALANSGLQKMGAVATRVDGITDVSRQRSLPFAERKKAQQTALNLPHLPTTTIGSFPQTDAIRQCRRNFRQQRISEAQYRQIMEQEIEDTIRRQQALGLDVLVHGEPERNDMVEYFGESLAGYTISRNGWVQSYGTRCVKPPIIYGDIYREKPLTVNWARYAQSLTDQPVKGMLTGPVTMLAWAFTREDLPLSEMAEQLALALRDEIADLESVGIQVVQVDEPALREKLPLRAMAQPAYLQWAADAFRLATAAARPTTQIHTHMCYSQFREILDGIQSLDADVITIEAARTEMALVRQLREAEYTRDVGPGIYDIHSPLIPDTAQLEARIRRALETLPASQLWINPDCGLKTRQWPEVEAALGAMVSATRGVRASL